MAATGRAHGGGEVGTSGGRESGSDYGDERFLFSLGVPCFQFSEATYPITRQRKPAQPNQTPVTFPGSDVIGRRCEIGEPNASMGLRRCQ